MHFTNSFIISSNIVAPVTVDINVVDSKFGPPAISEVGL